MSGMERAEGSVIANMRTVDKSRLLRDRLNPEQIGKQRQLKSKQNKSSPKPSCTSATKLAETVNDSCQVSLKSRSEPEHCFEERSEHEKKNLLKRKGEREVDVLIHRVAATAKKLVKLADYIEDPLLKMSTFVLENHLSAKNLKCIESIYGDRGLDFIDLLRNCREKALPVLRIKLTQKHQECSGWLAGPNRSRER